MYAVVSLLRQWYIGVRLIKIELPKHVAYIIDKLCEHGYEAFAVGGCVRDAVMGRTPHDWDITTSAMPEEVKAIFKRTIDTGIKHGTVTIMLDKVGYEVTTYRIDGEYKDGRHPDAVLFTRNLTEDLKRRDFTINAMAYNDTVGIVDEFGGIEDLKNGVIRCVGKAVDRFSEDALRILRAVRFAAQLNFSIEKNTYEAIRELSRNLKLISRERIQTELVKLITSNHPEKIQDIYELGLAKYLFDNTLLSESTDDSLYVRVSEIMNNSKTHSYLRYAGLLTFESNVQEVLRALKLDNKTIKTVANLVAHKDYPLIAEPIALRRAIVDVGEEVFREYYLDYIKSLVLSKETEMTMDEYDSILETYKEIVVRGDCLNMCNMQINGNDLREQGITDGKEIGATLKYLFSKVVDEPEINNKEKLLELVRSEILGNRQV